jgi:hypothetical protein
MIMPPSRHAPWLAGDVAVVLAAVASCPGRGSVLPHTAQPECGCAELTECHAGRSHGLAGVTLAECVACRWEALGLDDPDGPATKP